ncbi:hypothetical protein VTK56DRAFT_3293 [Thermocarpiscus australiensis]
MRYQSCHVTLVWMRSFFDLPVPADYQMLSYSAGLPEQVDKQIACLVTCGRPDNLLAAAIGTQFASLSRFPDHPRDGGIRYRYNLCAAMLLD